MNRGTRELTGRRKRDLLIYERHSERTNHAARDTHTLGEKPSVCWKHVADPLVGEVGEGPGASDSGVTLASTSQRKSSRLVRRARAARPPPFPDSRLPSAVK